MEHNCSMRKYVALLRGINVSGKNKISMADLVALFEDLGFTEIKTYLQSGNVVFKAKPACNSRDIEKAILGRMGFEVPVLVLEASRLKTVFQNNPFIPQEGINPDHCHVTFLWNKPPAKLVAAMKHPTNESGKFAMGNDCLYLHCPNGYGRTKINNQFFEKKLHTVATTRNWKTVSSLVGLS